MHLITLEWGPFTHHQVRQPETHVAPYTRTYAQTHTLSHALTHQQVDQVCRAPQLVEEAGQDVAHAGHVPGGGSRGQWEAGLVVVGCKCTAGQGRAGSDRKADGCGRWMWMHTRLGPVSGAAAAAPVCGHERVQLVPAHPSAIPTTCG